MNQYPEQVLDPDEYPTDETLNAIATWAGDWVDLFSLVHEAWKYPDRISVENDGEVYTVKASTGGWSGNEDVIDALSRNFIAWAACWESSHRGGLYVFEFPYEPPIE